MTGRARRPSRRQDGTGSESIIVTQFVQNDIDTRDTIEKGALIHLPGQGCVDVNNGCFQSRSIPRSAKKCSRGCLCFSSSPRRSRRHAHTAALKFGGKKRSKIFSFSSPMPLPSSVMVRATCGSCASPGGESLLFSCIYGCHVLHCE